MFKYGEKLYRFGWWPHQRKLGFRFRIDPVPYIGGRHSYYGGYKSPKMRKRERSLYYEHSKLVKMRKSLCAMPDPWDDVQRGDVGSRKGWKDKKIKRQWMKDI